MKAFAWEVTLDLSGIAGCHFNTETVFIFADDMMDVVLQLEEITKALRTELEIKIGTDAANELQVISIVNHGAIVDGKAHSPTLKHWAARTARMIKKDMDS